MVISNVSSCPECGGTLKYYDKVRRIIRTKGGVKEYIKVMRFKCVDCNRLNRLLPDTLYPYKHYVAEIIDGVLSGIITSDILEFEDYPCEMTIKRWTRK